MANVNSWRPWGWARRRQAHLDVFGDKSTIIHWINGTRAVKNRSFRSPVGRAKRMLRAIWQAYGRTAVYGGEWLRHEFREGNTKADAITDFALRARANNFYDCASSCFLPGPHKICSRCNFDGAQKDLHAAAGLLGELWGGPNIGWQVWKASNYYFGDATNTTAE